MSRDRSRKDHPDYRRGYRDGRLYGTGHNHGRAAAGGKPPRGCLRRLLLLPLLIPLALARHRATDQRDRADSHPDRLGAHHPTRPPFAGATGRPRGDWHTDRDAPPEHQGGGPRRPLRDNLEEK
jgi:hypothetical protein